MQYVYIICVLFGAQTFEDVLICDLNKNKIHNSGTAIFKINFLVVS